MIYFYLDTYKWLADGTKLGVTDANGNGFDYVASLIYKRDGGELTLESASFSRPDVPCRMVFQVLVKVIFKGAYAVSAAPGDVLYRVSVLDPLTKPHKPVLDRYIRPRPGEIFITVITVQT